MAEQQERLELALTGKYTIERQLGSGGMATVYLAEDLKHRRKVAIKVLRPELAHSIGVDRFLREIEVIARLQHPHILTLIDSGNIDDQPYYVMPYVEGESLRARALGAALPIDEAVAIVREIADGLHYAHQHGVIHRDIKPENVLMSGGHPVIADFGIAAALEHATEGRMTETGISLGSPVYMSPEQAAGDRDLDARSDIYSLGCVLYELLSGVAPIEERSLQRVVTRKMMGEFRPVREVQPDVPAELDAVIRKALATNAADRYAHAKAFADALEESVERSTAEVDAQSSKRTRRAVVIGAVVVLAAVATLFAQSRARSERLLLATQRLGELELLSTTGQHAKAFAIGQELLAVIPDDTTLERLRPVFTDFIPVITDPPGASVYGQSYDDPIDTWVFLGTTPLDSLPVPKQGSDLTMRLKIEAEGFRTVELLPHALSKWGEWRRVFPMDTVRLDGEAHAPPGMVRVPGFSIPDPLHENSDSIHLGDYFIGRYEVTNREYKAFVDADGYRNLEYWPGPFVRDGHELIAEEAIAEFKDQTGRPGPSTWRLGAYPEGQEQYPVSGVSVHEALAYARFRDAELPTSDHWDAARRFTRESWWIVGPRSNLSGEGPREVGAGRSMNAYGVYDMAGNVREWLANAMPGGRMTRGASWSESPFQVGWRIVKPAFDRSEGNGIRLMKQFEDDTTVAHVSRPLEVTGERDYRDVAPVSEVEYRIYRRLYTYEPTPLNSEVDTTGSANHYDWEKVTFDAAYGGERAAAYVMLPKEGTPPYQPILYWPGSGAMNERFVNHDGVSEWMGFIPRSGRALVLPVYKGAFERDDEEFSTTISVSQRHTSYYRELAIQWVKDLGRTVDYLETRDDIDAERVGFYGLSWGGQIAPIPLAVDTRIRAAVLDVGGLWVYRSDPLPEVEPLNFLPHVTTPVLMLNGEHDVVFPLETGQKPFFELLGTPEADKRHFIYPAGHLVPRDIVITRTLDWFDRYLGVPGR